MKLHQLNLCNFQSFGPEITKIDLEDLTFLIGPNGSGKTAVFQALCRLFAFDPSLRRIRRSDFHIPINETEEQKPEERTFWIEAEFIFPELIENGNEYPTIPPNFAHMRLDSADAIPRVRFRLEATMNSDGEIDDELNYVLDVDAEDIPLNKAKVSRSDRNNIQVHYLPARRDPSEHISYTTNSLLGRVLRSVNWQAEREIIKSLTEGIGKNLATNNGVESIGGQLSKIWQSLHKGEFFKAPQITFVSNEIETLLRHLSLSFSPGHGEQLVDFSRLSDGQKSMLYLSIMFTVQGIGRAVLSGENDFFDVEKLRPAIFTIVSMEEPENSLSPHYLGRIIEVLMEFVKHHDAQAFIATHAPSALRRIPPKNIRYMRLNSSRQSEIRKIVMPLETDEAHKFVREAVQSYPELYFSRLVVLGEGDSEEIVLPRLLKAKGFASDEAAISVVPLGGRHVNHFWRLLRDLEIPFLTLLDLDLGRYEGGWGRVRYVVKQLIKFPPKNFNLKENDLEDIPKWNSEENILTFDTEPTWFEYLENFGIYFSSPLDLDFGMLKSFPTAYSVSTTDLIIPEESTIKAVLGKSYHGVDQYADDEKILFLSYHKCFKLGSKPAAHLSAMGNLSDDELLSDMPDSLNRLTDEIIACLMELPE